MDGGINYIELPQIIMHRTGLCGDTCQIQRWTFFGGYSDEIININM